MCPPIWCHWHSVPWQFFSWLECSRGTFIQRSHSACFFQSKGPQRHSLGIMSWFAAPSHSDKYENIFIWRSVGFHHNLCWRRQMQPPKKTSLLPSKLGRSKASRWNLVLAELVDQEVRRIIQNPVQGQKSDIFVIKVQPFVPSFLFDVGCVMPTAGIMPQVSDSCNQIVFLRDAPLRALLSQPLRVHPANWAQRDFSWSSLCLPSLKGYSSSIYAAISRRMFNVYEATGAKMGCFGSCSRVSQHLIKLIKMQCYKSESHLLKRQRFAPELRVKLHSLMDFALPCCCVGEPAQVDNKKPG